ncbi:hypothetical protein SASPL_133096 [Salvia splendens]|uniref:Hydrophobic seed protein domain-containing protein n=1 Tax=Salvia splendens TaxID=180675 RepID=A0A8X8ZI04_SALSN|nr:hypothetical protein SASPL_133096 [Salvia splendens]
MVQHIIIFICNIFNMDNYKIAQIIIFLNLGTLLVTIACPYCEIPTPPKVKPPHPPKPPAPTPTPKPHVPKPPTPTVPPKVKPPYHPKPTPTVPPKVKPPPEVKPPPTVPKPPVVEPPVVPKPPVVTPTPPVVPKPPVVEARIRCTLKCACVDLLGGLVHIGVGPSTKEKCCPVLEGLAGLDAALCLCTTIKAKLLDINIILPIALEVLVGCGKNPPSGFQCPA